MSNLSKHTFAARSRSLTNVMCYENYGKSTMLQWYALAMLCQFCDEVMTMFWFKHIILFKEKD